jgi:hypothetical protein
MISSNTVRNRALLHQFMCFRSNDRLGYVVGLATTGTAITARTAGGAAASEQNHDDY